jgi:hypothetical protein
MTQKLFLVIVLSLLCGLRHGSNTWSFQGDKFGSWVAGACLALSKTGA